MESSSNLYKLQHHHHHQQQIGSNYSSLAASPQSTSGAPPIHQWFPTMPPLNYSEYEHYMNEILPMSAQVMTTKNHINYGCDEEVYERCPNPPNCTNTLLSQNTVIDLNQNLRLSTCSNSTFLITNYLNHNVDSSYSESSSSNKTSACKYKLGISQKKRVCGSSQSDGAAKKQKPAASQSSSQLPKVVKEKIGDRIAALHRLVAPFGKTDSASVLTEAIGYIQFLHCQIQKLSMSCQQPSQDNRLHCLQRVLGKQMKEGGDGDLTSRGFCLVPISVAAYIISSSTLEFH